MNKKNNSHTAAWVCGILTALFTSVGVTAQIQLRSSLVVGVMVEGLSGEYLERLAPYLGDGGFRRLINTSAAFTTVDYGPGIDAVAASAMIYTGAAPSVNGVPSALVYDTGTNSPRHVLYDATKIGNFTDETLSPSAINVSTLTDELKVDTGGESMIFSIAPSSYQAIITAGHAANGAFWLNDRTGAWATTTYYKDVPHTVTERNYRMPLSVRMDTMKWVPLCDASVYPPFAKAQSGRAFKYTYSKKDPDRYFNYKASPLSNSEITELAIDLLATMPMGADGVPDMLNVTYNLSRPTASAFEKADMYMRLDRDLRRLFEAVDRAGGIGRSTIFVVGVPGVEPSEPEYPRWHIPTGEFSVKKAISLLNLYLIAVHGNGDWISGYYHCHFYLNRKLIKDRGLDLSDFRAEVADFLARMSGVSGVYTIDDVLAARAGENPQVTKRNTSVAHAGDVIIEVNPGWFIVDAGTTSEVMQQRAAAPANPMFIIGPSVTPVKITHPVDARLVAPTVARAIHIRSPNGAVLPGMSF